MSYARSPYFLLFGFCLTRILIQLPLQNYQPLIPILQKEWAMTSTAAGSVVSAFQVGFLISLVGLSPLSDWVSTKKVFIYSCLASAVTALLFAFFARGYGSALILRGLLGLAIGGTYTPALKLISEIFSPSLRGRAMGFFIGAGSLSLAGSLALTGWIGARFGWEAAFYITALGPILGAVMPLILLKGLAERESAPTEREFKKELLENKPALLLIVGYTAHTWELEGMRAWTPAFLVACFMAAGLAKSDAIQGGASLASAILFMGVFSTAIAGYLSDRMGRTAVILAMMAVSILGSFTFGWMIGSSAAWMAILGLAYGFAVIAESPVYSSGLTELVAPRYLGTALGFRSLVGYGIGAIAPTAFGAILDWTNSPAGTSALGYVSIWGWAYSMLGLVALVGIWATVKLRSMPESSKMAGGKK